MNTIPVTLKCVMHLIAAGENEDEAVASVPFNLPIAI
jgi:hypothetical protein